MLRDQRRTSTGTSATAATTGVCGTGASACSGKDPVSTPTTQPQRPQFPGHWSRRGRGIGFFINKSIKLFQFDEMFTYILIVLVLIVMVDQISGAVRRNLAR